MTDRLIRFLIFTLLLVNTTAGQNRGEKRQQTRVPQSIWTSSANDYWYSFISPDKDFIIQFPSRPERLADTEAPSGTMRNYMLRRQAMVFQLAFLDTGLEPNSRDGNQLPLSFRQEMLDHAKKRGWVVIRSELLRVNVYEQETWSPTKIDPKQKLHYMERNIMRYGRQYILTCSSVVPNQKVDAARCHRFFGSFRVIGEPEPQ